MRRREPGGEVMRGNQFGGVMDGRLPICGNKDNWSKQAWGSKGSEETSLWEYVMVASLGDVRGRRKPATAGGGGWQVASLGE